MAFFGLLRPKVEKLLEQRDVRGLGEVARGGKPEDRGRAMQALVTLAVADISHRRAVGGAASTSSALEQLVGLGPPAVGPLVAALEGQKSALVAGELIKALARIGDPAAIPVLAKVATARDEEIGQRRTAAAALATIGDAKAAGPLLRLLHEDDTDLCIAALHGLARIGELRTIPAIMETLERPGQPQEVYKAGVAAFRAVAAHSHAKAVQKVHLHLSPSYQLARRALLEWWPENRHLFG